MNNLISKKLVVIGIFFFLGILSLLAFFAFQRESIKKKETAYPPTQSIGNFNEQKRQGIAQGDVINGKGIPGAKALILISPDGDKKEVDVDANGNWSYQIGEGIKDRKYRLTVTLYDKGGRLLNIKSYPITIAAKKPLSDASQKAFSLLEKTYAQDSCQLEPEHPQYDCANSKKCFNDYIPNVSCTSIIQAYPRFHCDTDEVAQSECIGRGTGWQGDPRNGTSPTSGCGTRDNPENQTCEEVAHFAPGEYCYTDFYRDESTQCKWIEDPAGRIQRCGTSVDPRCKPMPRDERQRTYELLSDHYPRDVYESEKKDWEKWMQSMDLFPVWSIEDEQEVIIDRETFQQEVCNGKPCFFDVVSEKGQQQIVNDLTDVSLEYYKALGDELIRNCYDPIPALKEYFPEIEDIQDYPGLKSYLNIEAAGGKCNANEDVKTEIEEEDLEEILNGSALKNFVANKLNEKGFGRRQSAITTTILNFFNSPLPNVVFPARAMSRVLLQKTLSGNDPRLDITGDVVDLGTFFIPSAAKAPYRALRGTRVLTRAEHAAVDAAALSDDLRGIKNALKEEIPCAAENVLGAQAQAGKVLASQNCRPRNRNIPVAAMDAAVERRARSWTDIRIPQRGIARAAYKALKGEDTYYWNPVKRRGAVFDGAGGVGSGGGPAANLAQQIAQQALDGMEIKEIISTREGLEEVKRQLRSLVDKINSSIASRFKGNSITTGEIAVIVEMDDGPHVVIAHVGDSRIYHERQGSIRQLTIDHQDNSPQFANNPPLTSALGMRGMRVDIEDHTLGPLDRLILMSDGVFEDNPQAELEAIIRTVDHQRGDIAQALVDAARKPDDKTAVVLEAYRSSPKKPTTILRAYGIPVLVLGGTTMALAGTMSIVGGGVRSNPVDQPPQRVSAPQNPNEVTIIRAPDTANPGDHISVSATLTRDGNRIDNSGNFSQKWRLEELQASRLTSTTGQQFLAASGDCTDTCTITIPNRLPLKTYALVVYVTGNNKTAVLASNFSPIAIGSQNVSPPPQATIVPPTRGNCRAPYERCGGDPGYEQYDRTNTVLVTPLCDSNGKIIDFQEKSEGNTGDCPR